MKKKVVVTGIGLMTPIGLDRDSAWKSITTGKSGIKKISSFDTENFQTKIAAEITDFSPDEILGRKFASRLDRFAQFACVTAKEAIKDSGIYLDAVDLERFAVLIGSGIGGIKTLSDQFNVLSEKGPSRISPFLVPMMLSDMASGQVSMMLGTKGPNFSTVSACASAADSIGQGLHMIRRGEADIVLAGGSEAAICPIGIAGFNSARALSTNNDNPEEASRPFDAKRDGFVLGEGAGLIVLEDEEHALKRGATIICELSGYGATSDAHHVTQPHPEGEGASKAMDIAISDAGIEKEKVAYINAHGTSTQLNDKFETIAIKKSFGDHAKKLKISSTKSMTGHLLGAAGGIEAAFTCLAINEKVVPPTINLLNPDPECDLDYVANHALKGNVPAAISNSLGFGGHNASLLFQDYPNQ
ncbi:MAG: beta-ketoacyl-ACP synthase II [Dehalococcoidia bacterium]|jgi:3-oxoacyl-[acyl-carrier-protein] synthase II|nr:beta-ketoacyl-ACP synthase II [Dehalococcoidia bacterium]|tara:strand:- start:267 stop:1511 length:1245 start_codon:yes stop_codon:yes gene_type:complete